MKFNNDRKKLLKKRIILKNGEPVKLEFYQLPDILAVYAIDKNNEVVGELSFEIMQKFVCPLTEEERAEEAMARKFPLSMIKKDMQFSIFLPDRNKFEIHDDILTLDGEKYKLFKTSAILNYIEIKDRKFFQVGLGSAMHKEMENYARKIKCDEIRLALYHPFGEFQNGTRPFYEHMGYVFENTNGTTSVFKLLTEEKVAKTSVGTPINEKYFKEKQKNL